MDMLKDNGSMRANFTESKHVRVLDAPLESSGELSFVAPLRLEKRTFKPRAEVLVLEGDTMSMERGSNKRSISLSDFPEVGAMVQSMRAAIAGDRVALERYFEAQATGTRERWQLKLTPRQQKIGITLREIVLSGNANYIHTIEMLLTDGDRSVMSLERPKQK
jgi:Outer membrane lipoprotein carrier protein LolA-like